MRREDTLIEDGLEAPHLSAGVEWTTPPSDDVAGTSLKEATVHRFVSELVS